MKLANIALSSLIILSFSASSAFAKADRHNPYTEITPSSAVEKVITMSSYTESDEIVLRGSANK